MNKLKATVGILALLAAAEMAASTSAFARGGAANIMNSPGYQRRLQESRGYVTNQSGSLFPHQPARASHGRRWRRRH